MGKLISLIVRVINTLLCYFPYSDCKVNLNLKYVSADLGNCGIACVAMITNPASMSGLIKSYKRKPFYQDPVGWYHNGLVEILNDANWWAKTKQALTLWQLRKLLAEGKPVIVSLKVPEPHNLSTTEIYTSLDPNVERVGHLCLLTGFNAHGFYLHDPRNLKGYGQNTFVPYKTYATIFTGNGIVIVKKID